MTQTNPHKREVKQPWQLRFHRTAQPKSRAVSRVLLCSGGNQHTECYDRILPYHTSKQANTGVNLVGFQLLFSFTSEIWNMLAIFESASVLLASLFFL